MLSVSAILGLGPDGASQFFAAVEANPDWLDLKQVADSCWTRAGLLAKSDRAEARRWGLAALAGYEYLATHAGAALAESARENAEALRGWKLLGEVIALQ